MAAEEGVPITPEILTWARSKSGLDFPAIYQKTKITEEQITNWEGANGQPTISQLRKLSKVFRRPPAFFFLEKISNEYTPPIADFRSIFSNRIEPKGNLLSILEFFTARRKWATEFADELELKKLDYVGSLAGVTDEEVLANRARLVLELDTRKLNITTNPSANLAEWITRFEDIGVFVGQFGQHPRFQITPFEISGICLVDERAPFVLLNMAEPPSRRIFTLVHEMIHLLRGMEGVSAPTELGAVPGTVSHEEQICERAAGMALMPQVFLAREFERLRELQPERIIRTIAGEIGISALSVLVRSYQSGLIPNSVYRRLSPLLRSTKRDKSSGGNYWNVWRRRIGVRFGRHVADAYNDRLLNVPDASSLLDVKASNLQNAVREIS